MNRLKSNKIFHYLDIDFGAELDVTFPVCLWAYCFYDPCRCILHALIAPPPFSLHYVSIMTSAYLPSGHKTRHMLSHKQKHGIRTAFAVTFIH